MIDTTQIPQILAPVVDIHKLVSRFVSYLHRAILVNYPGLTERCSVQDKGDFSNQIHFDICSTTNDTVARHQNRR